LHSIIPALDHVPLPIGLCERKKTGEQVGAYLKKLFNGIDVILGEDGYLSLLPARKSI